MKTIVCTQYGPPEVLQLQEREKPVPKDNEVLIKIHATSVTTGDCNVRGLVFIPPGLRLLARLMLGFRGPRNNIPGIDLAGEVEAVGKDVTLFKEGDQVYGADGNGGACAEYKCMPEDGALAIKPANISYKEAASVPFGALTAWYFLREKGNIRSGHKVLINGASGSVGSAAVQIASYFGTEVTGVCSGANLELVKSLGADTVIDYTQEDFATHSERYDMILDTVVGKTSFSRCRESLKPTGLYLAVAGGLRELVQMLQTAIIGEPKVIFGGGMECEQKAYLVYLRKLIEAGEIRAVIDRSYPLEQIAEAHRYVDKGHKKGNVVIAVTSDDNA